MSSRDSILRIGSRGSPLALWQAHHVAGCLERLGIATCITIIKTTGDHLQTASLMQAGGKGLFTKEIESALLAQEIDLAVHSLKDLPTEDTPGLTIAAVPEREDPRDALCGLKLDDLPLRAPVGTSSGRRGAQLKTLRPDLEIQPVRGNVDTRLRKLKEGQFAAIMLAAAGLHRLALDREIAQIFTADQICPAAGQGALAIQTRVSDPARDVCKRLDHPATSDAVTCERAALSALGGGCQLPVGVYAEVSGGVLRVRGAVVSLEGGTCLRASLQGAASEARELGVRLAGHLAEQGAHRILAEVR